MSITWNEFKEKVDQAIKEKNGSGDEKLCYIDYPDVYLYDPPEVSIDDDGITIN